MITAQYVVTEECNLKCSYCYVNQNKVSMTKETFDSSFEKFKQSIGESPYKFDFFGGEPLKNWGLVKYVVGILNADKFCKTKTLVTNGLLLDKNKVDFLEDNKVRVIISFDGLWSDKRGYDLIPNYLKNKDLFKRLGNSFNTMIHPDNLNLVDNYDFVISRFDMIPNFKLIRDDVWKEDHISKFKEEFRRLCHRCEYYLTVEGKNYLPDIIKNSIYRLKMGLVDGVIPSNCGAGTEIHCYSPSGEKYPCERYATNGKKSVESSKFEECLKCDISSVCEKGCLFLNEQKGINKNLCEIYKIIFEEVIDLNHRMKNNKSWKKIVTNLDGVIYDK